MKKNFFYLLLLILPLKNASAIDFEQITQDFKPISGYIVKSIGNEFIIDTGYSKSCKVGDIFSVIEPGQKLVHPVSKKIIASIEKTKGIIKVINVKSNFAYTRPLYTKKKINRGDRIKRFHNIKAFFLDASDNEAVPVYIQLRNKLNNFKWIQYTKQKSIKSQIFNISKIHNCYLLFIYKNSGLEIRDFKNDLVNYYKNTLINDNDNQNINQINNINNQFIIKNQNQFINNKSLTYQKNNQNLYPLTKKQKKIFFNNYEIIGNLKGTAWASDFVNHLKTLYLASAEGSYLRIYKIVENKISLITEKKIKTGAQILYVKWFRPYSCSNPFICLNLWSEQNIESLIFEFKNDQMDNIKSNINTLTNSFDTNNDGNPETLLSQSFNRNFFWGSTVIKIKSMNNFFGDYINIPNIYCIFGSLISDVNCDKYLDLIFIKKGILYIYCKNKLIYKTSNAGGNIASITYDIDIEAKKSLINTINIETSPIAVDIDKDKCLEVIFASSEKSFFQNSYFNSIKNSGLSMIKYEKGMFIKEKIASLNEKSINGIFADKEKLFLVINDSESNYSKSRLIYYNLFLNN